MTISFGAGQPQGRVAKVVLVSSVPPLMVKTDSNPEGTPIEVFDGFRAALAANHAQFFLDVPADPFYGYNRPGAEPSEGVIKNWWRQGMMGNAKAHYECIKAFSEADQTEDLKAITVPTLHPEAPAVGHLVGDEVKRPALVRRHRDAETEASETNHGEGPAIDPEADL